MLKWFSKKRRETFEENLGEKKEVNKVQTYESCTCVMSKNVISLDNVLVMFSALLHLVNLTRAEQVVQKYAEVPIDASGGNQTVTAVEDFKAKIAAALQAKKSVEEKVHGGDETVAANVVKSLNADKNFPQLSKEEFREKAWAFYKQPSKPKNPFHLAFTREELVAMDAGHRDFHAELQAYGETSSTRER